MNMSRETESSSSVPQDAAKPGADASESAEHRAEHLQEEVESARDDLGDLVGELDRRRHRAAKPIVVGAIALAVIGLGSYVLWRIFRSRPKSKLEQLRNALHVGAARLKVAPEPSVAKKIFTAAAAGVAAAAGRRAPPVRANEPS